MLYFNYNGLTYEWNYGNTVNVLDRKIAVDAFTFGLGTDPGYSNFLAAVVGWGNYIQEAGIYLGENADYSA